MLITRKKLISLGSSQYQSRMITQHLKPQVIEKRKYFYCYEEVIQAIVERRKNNRIRNTTRENLIELETKLRHLDQSEYKSLELVKLDQILAKGTEAMIRVRDHFDQLDQEQKKIAQNWKKHLEKNNIVPFFIVSQ